MSDTTETEDQKMWRAIKYHLGVQSFATVQWRTIYQAMRELGYPLLPHQAAALDGAEPLGPRIVEKPLKEGWWQKYDE